MIRLRADISAFLRDYNRIGKAIPEAIVLGLAKTAQRGRDAVRRRTRQVFKLHTDYIPNSIRSIPDPHRAKAIAAATRALVGRHRDFSAAVYLRGSSNPKKSLAFLALHETGGVKRPAGGRALAAPGRDLRRYSFRTSRGAVRRGWKPEKLLEYYNRVGAADKGSIQRTPNTRGKPKAFILESGKGRGRMIVRRKSRKSRDLEILYQFLQTAQIDKRWGWVKTVRSTVERHLSRDIANQINKVR